jgi:hypothetical protein
LLDEDQEMTFGGLPFLAHFGHAEAVATCPLLGEERKSLLTLKMNHRAARRRIPLWNRCAIQERELSHFRTGAS